jgi:hypothetical protein
MWYDPLSTPSSVVRLKTSHLCYKMSHHCDAWSKHQNGTMQDRRIQVGSQAEYPGSWTKGYIIVVISPIILNIWRSKPLKCWENDNVLWIGPRILANIYKDQQLWRDKANTVSPWCLAQTSKWMWQDHCVDSIIMPNHKIPWAQEFRRTYICVHNSQLMHQMHHLFKPWNMLEIGLT